MFDSAETVPVMLSDGTEILVRVISTGETKVSAESVFDFGDVKKALTSLAREISGVFEAVRPDKASVKLNIEITAKSGKLTTLIVEGGGKAALEVMFEWVKKPAAPDYAD